MALTNRKKRYLTRLYFFGLLKLYRTRLCLFGLLKLCLLCFCPFRLRKFHRCCFGLFRPRKFHGCCFGLFHPRKLHRCCFCLFCLRKLRRFYFHLTVRRQFCIRIYSSCHHTQNSQHHPCRHTGGFRLFLSFPLPSLPLSFFQKIQKGIIYSHLPENQHRCRKE